MISRSASADLFGGEGMDARARNARAPGSTVAAASFVPPKSRARIKLPRTPIVLRFVLQEGPEDGVEDGEVHVLDPLHVVGGNDDAQVNQFPELPPPISGDPHGA